MHALHEFATCLARKGSVTRHLLRHADKLVELGRCLKCGARRQEELLRHCANHRLQLREVRTQVLQREELIVLQQLRRMKTLESRLERLKS